MKVNFNTQKTGYNQTNKNNKNTQFKATIKEGTLAKAVGDTVEFIGGDQARILTKNLAEAKDRIKILAVEGKNLVFEFAVNTAADTHSAGRNYTKITPQVKSLINGNEFIASSSFGIASDTEKVGSKLADEFIGLSVKLTKNIENSRILIEEDVLNIEKYINGAK